MPRRGRLLGCLLATAALGAAASSTFRSTLVQPHLGTHWFDLASAFQNTELTTRYGATVYSQGNEERLIRDFFNDQRGGFFLDIGAGDARRFSNTAYLEERLGWSGIAVDAEASHRDGYLKYRPRTRFFAFFVSGWSDQDVDFYVNPSWVLSSGDRAFAEGHGPFQTVRVRSITLNKLLETQRVERIDLLSMDIEDGEPAALAGFDIRRYRPRLVCIEAHPTVLLAIEEYFRRNAYLEIVRAREYDLAAKASVNRYYMPAGTRPRPTSILGGGE